ncbi:MAG: nuclear transport factor 2 family protein [Bacteroidota bacterium]
MKTIAISVLLAAAAGTAVAQDNLQTVQDIYARFGQGDIPGILEKLSPDAVWVHGADPAVVPYGGTYQGVAGAGEFFQKLGQNAQITSFTPSNFRVDGNKVMSDMAIEGKSLTTGKNWSENSVFVWEFDDSGKVARWEATGDFASMNAAFK